MEQKAKFVIIGLIGLLLASIVIILQFNNSKQTLESQISKLNSDNAVLNKKVEEAKNLAGQINSLKDDLTRLANEKIELQKKIEELNSEIERQENNNLQIETKLKNDNTMLKAKIKALNKEKKALTERVSVLVDENIGVTNKFDEMGKLLKDKIAEVENIKNKLPASEQGSIIFDEEKKSVELTPIVVRPLSSSYTADKVPFVGKILAINRENSFVVISLGQDSGVKTGDRFLVFRNDKPIASIEVIQIRNTIAACDIIKELKTIKVGDAVKINENK